MEALNGELNAVIHPLFEKALAAEPAAGPFQGVPMVVKDLACHTAGDPYHEGMGFLKGIGWREEEDTWLARRFREAGFVFVGRTNTPELGILPTTEPERLRGHAQPVGSRATRRAARAAAPARPWRRAWSRSATPTTAAARSASPPARAASWG